MRHLWWIPVLVLMASACGGGTDDSVGTVDGTVVVVESADGLATLSLSERSLPDGASPDDVRLAVAFNDTADDGFPVMGVQLLPHGVFLTESATLTIALPPALDGGFMAIHESGNFVEFLDGEVTQSDESLVFTTLIEHFSLVYIFDGVVAGSMTLAPNPVSPDQVQEAEVTVTVNDPVSLVMGESACEDGCHGADFTRYEFSVSPISFRDSEIAWGEAPASLANWDPAVRVSEVIEAAGRWESFASSTCLTPNTSEASSLTGVIHNLTLLGSSEPNDIEFLDFAGALGEEQFDYQPDPIDVQPNEGELSTFNLDALQPGDTFRAVSFSEASAEAVCTDATSTTSASSPSSTLPDDDDPEGDAKKDSDDAEKTPAEEAKSKGGDIKSARSVRGDGGENVFIITMYGDGRQAAADATNFLVDIEVRGSEAWGTRVEFRLGEAQHGRVWLGELAPGRDELEGADVSMEWTDSDTLKVTVAGTGTALEVETFKVGIGVFFGSFGQDDYINFWDYAAGAGSP